MSPPFRTTDALDAGRRRTLGEVVRFGLVGLLNTLVGYTVFSGLVMVGIGPTTALIVATVVGTVFNFHTSRRLVFRSTAAGGLMRAVRFLSVYLGILLLNWLALQRLLQAGVYPVVAQGLLILPMAGLSFTGQKLLVFRRQRSSA